MERVHELSFAFAARAACRMLANEILLSHGNLEGSRKPRQQVYSRLMAKRIQLAGEVSID